MLPGILMALQAIATITAGAPKLAQALGTAFDIGNAVIEPVARYMELIKLARAEGRDISDAELAEARAASKHSLDKYLAT